MHPPASSPRRPFFPAGRLRMKRAEALFDRPVERRVLLEPLFRTGLSPEAPPHPLGWIVSVVLKASPCLPKSRCEARDRGGCRSAIRDAESRSVAAPREVEPSFTRSSLRSLNVEFAAIWRWMRRKTGRA